MDSNRNRLYYVGRVGFNVRGEREIARKGNENENERRRDGRISGVLMQHKPFLDCYPGLPKAEEL